MLHKIPQNRVISGTNEQLLTPGERRTQEGRYLVEKYNKKEDVMRKKYRKYTRQNH